MADDLTVAILREIRDELKGTNSRLDQTNSRLDQTNSRLDQTNSRLDQTNSRLEVVEKTLADFAAQHLLLTRYVKNVVDRQEKAIEDINERLVWLEERAGKTDH
jgi:chromosome segregation ATPase